MPHPASAKSHFRNLRPDSWLVQHIVSEQFDHFSLHQHESYEFYLHISNGQAYQVADQVIPLHPYQLVIVPPHQEHGLYGSTPRIQYERLFVQVHPTLLSQITFGTTSLRDIIDQHCETGTQQIYISPLEYLHIKEVASFIPAVGDAATPLDVIEALGCLSVLLSRFCRAITNNPTAIRISTADALAQEVHNYIQAHFSEDCSLNALAARFNVSKYHLSRRFREIHGMSLHHFVLRCRIAYAQVLIRQGEPMAAVFERCGFNDYSAFVRAFGQFTGMNPREWRSQQRTTSAARDTGSAADA